MSTIESTFARPLCRALDGNQDTLLSREWLLTNGRGGFASGTVAGVPARRYHGYLIAARKPPLERFMMLSGMAETVTVGNRQFRLAMFEHHDGLHGNGGRHLHDFDYDIAPPHPWVQWRYRTPVCDILKRVTIHSNTNLVSVSYEVSCNVDEDVTLEVAPLMTLRDFHGIRQGDDHPDWECVCDGSSLWIKDRQSPELTLAVASTGRDGATPIACNRKSDRTDGVFYRAEAARGYSDTETQRIEAVFSATDRRKLTVELVAGAFYESVDDMLAKFKQAMSAKKTLSQHGSTHSDRMRRRLEDAANQFIAERASAEHRGQATILAGYHWFGDWGRDAFIALEGLLLSTKRFDEARQVLRTFAGAQRNGLIPNLFDDYSGECHYNSVDASLWYVHAADRYLTLSEDASAWSEFLATTCRQVVDSFAAGTDFNIAVDDQGLVRCGHENVQITWMDAKCGDVVFTPRHGRPVEVNALWYHALRICERRFRASDPSIAKRCADLAERCAESFNRVFQRENQRGLYDVVRDDFSDASVRPNQIFAVSLEDSLLPDDRKREVFEEVTQKLLTPYGLRSLAPDDPAYRGRYHGSLYERDAAYHQGTVWSWLIGPYVEAYLRIHAFSDAAKDCARDIIKPLLEHLDEAGLGSISENFEGDQPHTPCTCIAQAWSVAELIRVMAMVES